jgi:hypothetical protein
MTRTRLWQSYVATFHANPTELDGSHYSQEKGISDYIPSPSADRFMGPHSISPLLQPLKQ